MAFLWLLLLLALLSLRGLKASLQVVAPLTLGQLVDDDLARVLHVAATDDDPEQQRARRRAVFVAAAYAHHGHAHPLLTALSSSPTPPPRALIREAWDALARDLTTP